MASQAAAKKALNVVVFLGTVRESNMGSRAAKFMVNQLSAKGHKVQLLDPDELNFPLLKKALHHYQDRTQAPQLLQDTNKIIVDADAVVVVSAEYNHCLPPALTNLVAHFPGSSFKYKPAGIVCYSMGPFGGQRAAMQARCLLGEIGCPSTSYLFSIPTIQNQLSEAGEPLNDRMTTNADKLIQELEWYATAIRNHKDTVGLPS